MLIDVDCRKAELAFEVESLERQERFMVERMREFLDDQRALLDEHSVIEEDVSRADRADNVAARVVSLGKVDPGSSDDDEEPRRGAEAS